MSLEEQDEDKSISIRPKDFGEFIGQELIKENMQVFVKAALNRKEMLDHVLLSGPPGLGKTTFSLIIAKETGANLKATSAPTIEKTGDMAALLSSLKENNILFIDEIHRLKPAIEEVLYSAMEDFSLDLNLGQGELAKTVKITLPPFTLIGATTKAGSLTQPLISRFGIIERFEFYNFQELQRIVKRNAHFYKIKIDNSGIEEIAKRSRGTPRVLNRLLKRVRDFAQVENRKIIDKEITIYALEKMNIDSLGLEEMDRNILKVIIQDFKGGPVGVDNLATSLSEDVATIEDVYEPYLIQKGFLKRTSRGRMVTVKAYEYLKLPSNKAYEKSLFDSSDINSF